MNNFQKILKRRFHAHFRMCCIKQSEVKRLRAHWLSCLLFFLHPAATRLHSFNSQICRLNLTSLIFADKIHFVFRGQEHRNRLWITLSGSHCVISLSPSAASVVKPAQLVCWAQKKRLSLDNTRLHLTQRITLQLLPPCRFRLFYG